MFSQRLLTQTSLFSLASLAASQSAIQFDGRVPAGTQLSAFDSDNGLFNPSNVFGKNVTFSQLLQLPDVAPSLFDVGTVPLEVTIKYVPTTISNHISGPRRPLTTFIATNPFLPPVQTTFSWASAVLSFFLPATMVPTRPPKA
jgi:hypothetical protein